MCCYVLIRARSQICLAELEADSRPRIRALTQAKQFACCTPATQNYIVLFDKSIMCVAGVQGLEPRLTVPETAVLPLDDTPK